MDTALASSLSPQLKLPSALDSSSLPHLLTSWQALVHAEQQKFLAQAKSHNLTAHSLNSLDLPSLEGFESSESPSEQEAPARRANCANRPVEFQLHAAVAAKDHNSLVALLREFKGDINGERSGLSMLGRAIKVNDWVAAQYLITVVKANVNGHNDDKSNDGKSGPITVESNLIRACASPRCPLWFIKLLLDHGAELNYTMKTLIFPESSSIPSNQADSSAEIKENNAESKENESKDNIKPPKETQATEKEKEFESKLKQLHLTNSSKRVGKTALMAAAESGRVEFIKLLISYGADLHVQDEYGNTALISSCLAGSASCAVELMLAGADCMQVNHSGLSAADVASDAASAKVIELAMNYARHQLSLALEQAQACHSIAVLCHLTAEYIF
jgi:hypothetical protein